MTSGAESESNDAGLAAAAAAAIVGDAANYTDYYLAEDADWASYYPGVDEAAGGEAAKLLYPATQWQNVAVLSLVFAVAVSANLCALPVILFRRTKFGNGLFAVLILCLTISDLAVTFFSVLGSLIVEASHFLWGGAPGSCQAYHWLSAWLSGLSAYLLVAIIGMVMVKTTTSCLQRLRDCRWLLLALLVTSGLLALPELFIRTTADLGELQDFCILGASGPIYFAYVAFRLLLRHVFPAGLVLAAVLRPETQLSKRVSHLFFGHLTAPCTCAEDGSALGLPHECPPMQTAMLKSANGTGDSSSRFGANGNTICAEEDNIAENGQLHTTPLSGHIGRPDVVADSEPVGFLKNGKVHKLLIQPEDPHRRRYKRFLALFFLVVSVINLVLDLSLQIQTSHTDVSLDDSVLLEPDNQADSSGLLLEYDSDSAVPSSIAALEYANPADTLATALYVVGHLQQIGDPIIFLVAEFAFS